MRSNLHFDAEGMRGVEAVVVLPSGIRARVVGIKEAEGSEHFWRVIERDTRAKAPTGVEFALFAPLEISSDKRNDFESAER